MNCSTPDFPVHHQHQELAQTHVHWVSDAIQPTHPLLSPSPPAFSLFQHQGLLQWVSSSQYVAKVSELQLHHQSFQLIFRTNFLYSWLVWSPCSPRDSQESSTPQFKRISYLALSFLYGPAVIPIPTALTRWTFVGKVMSMLFNMLSTFVIAFLPRSKGLLISWLQSPSAVILESKKMKSVTVSITSPSICYEVMVPDVMILAFWMMSFKPAFSLFSFRLISRLFSSPSLSAIRIVPSIHLRLLIFLLAIFNPAYDSSSPGFCMMYST